jgi:DNA gyrase subunit A
MSASGTESGSTPRRSASKASASKAATSKSSISEEGPAPAHGTSYPDGSVYEETLGRVYELDVENEMHSSFLAYSMSVIVARALPDARDGLKPVQRRILYAAHEMGLRPEKSHVKCARLVGEVMGRYHPHGDSAIYEALVRMAQGWSLNVPMIDPQGNFGSRDDGPAASRYTEARMGAAAMAMVGELDEGTVDFRPTYDDSDTEPSVLPAGIPNLLVNGTSGIAVGMATNMAPHNLGETIAACRAMLANRKITDEELGNLLPAPDFPTGGVIVGLSGVREAYATGRGSFKLRCKATITDVTPRKKGIVVTELPYAIGPEQVIEKIKEAISAKRLIGVADVKDLSDRRTGLKLVIEAKAGHDPVALLAELYALTPLQVTYTINNTALVDGSPRVMNLRDLLGVYLDHRIEVVRRRTAHRLAKAQARAHIVEGYLTALARIEEVVATIRATKDTDAARKALMKGFALDELQANAILEMTLRRLTGLEVSKLTEELRELRATITTLSAILASDAKLRTLVANELSAVADKFPSPRRSTLLETDDSVRSAASAASGVARPAGSPCTLIINGDGTLRRITGTDQGTAALAPASEKGKNVGAPARSWVTCHGGDLLAAITSSGRILHLHAADIPETPIAGRDVVSLAASEDLVALAPTTGAVITLVTELGVVKRIRSEDLPRKSGAACITLAEHDHLTAAVVVAAEQADNVDLIIISTDAQLLRTSAAAIRPQGASSAGMAGMRLNEDARVLAAGVVTSDTSDHLTGANALVVTVATGGAAKISEAGAYPVKGRSTGGVRCQTLRKAETALIAAAVLPASHPVLVMGSGTPTRLNGEPTRRDGSGDLSTPATVRTLASGIHG